MHEDSFGITTDTMPITGALAAPQPVREAILDGASEKITVDRQAEYGPASDSFERTAALWTAREMHLPNARVYTAVDVAQMMALLKMSRLAFQPGHADSWEDLVGYGALGGELAAS